MMSVMSAGLAFAVFVAGRVAADFARAWRVPNATAQEAVLHGGAARGYTAAAVWNHEDVGVGERSGVHAVPSRAGARRSLA